MLAAIAIVGGSVLARMIVRSAGWFIETIAHGVAFVAFLLGAVLEVSVGGKTVLAQLVSVRGGRPGVLGVHRGADGGSFRPLRRRAAEGALCV